MEVDERLLPDMNIGMIGHVDHGKTTLTEALTGTWTDRHSEERKRGISIRLGYADMTIYKCSNCKSLSTSERCIKCFSTCEPIRTVSFVDVPGHEALIATVLAGTVLMDAAILVISANEKCPQPQTEEHLMAAKIAGIKDIIAVQNKVDIVSKERAMESYKEIKDFLERFNVDAPIIPVSAQKRIGINYLIEAIEERFRPPKRNAEERPLFLIARSFDVNTPGTDASKLKGGVIGGSVVKGVLNVGDEIEIKPGIDVGGRYTVLKTKIMGMQKRGINIDKAYPGGLLGVMTDLDPYLTKSDRISGNIAGLAGTLPETKNKISVEFKGFSEMTYCRDSCDINVNDIVMVTVYTMRSVGIVKRKSKDEIEIDLKIPVCVSGGERVALSKQVAGRWRLVGYGIVE